MVLTCFSAITNIALAATVGCAPQDQCLPWVQIGETYQVEVLEFYDFENPRWGRVRAPYPHFSEFWASCGGALGDELEGSTRAFTAVRKLSLTSVDCRPIVADTPVPGTVVSSEWVSDWPFARRAEVRVRDGRQSLYTIGLVAVEDAFLAAHEQGARTDHMLVRSFDYGEGCRDSYFVRIRDERGRLITRDLGTGDDSGDGGP